MIIQLFVSEFSDWDESGIDFQAQCGANWLSLSTTDLGVVADHLENFIEGNL